MPEGEDGLHVKQTPDQVIAALREQMEAFLRQHTLWYEKVLYLKGLLAKRYVEHDGLRTSDPQRATSDTCDNFLRLVNL